MGSIGNEAGRETLPFIRHCMHIAAGVTVSLRKFAGPLCSFVGKGASYHCKTIFSQWSVVSEADNDRQQPPAFLRRRIIAHKELDTWS